MSEDRSTPRPWLSAYPPGVPPEIDLGRLGTLVDRFERNLVRYGRRPALQSFGAQLSYDEVGRLVRCLAAWIAAQGCGRGDRIAIMMPNVVANPVAILGTLVAGCTVVNVNPLYTPRELAAQLNDSGARMLFVLENVAHTVAEALPAMPSVERIVIAAPGDGLGLRGKAIDFASRYIKRIVPPYTLPADRVAQFDAVLRAGRDLPKPDVLVEPDDLAFLQYTGGTTGVAKGAMLSHRNVSANVEQCRLWIEKARDDGHPPVMITALPLYHIFALTACFLFIFEIGGCCLLVANPRDGDSFVKTLAANRFTHFAGVNTLFNLLNNHPKFPSVDFSALRFVIGGGMAVQGAVAARWKAITGRPIIEGYGLSETSPVVSINRVDVDDWTGTIGLPLPSTEVSMRGADGSPLPLGTPGELCVRGPQVMSGYWNRPEETAGAMTRDGYFRTGDVAVMAPDGQIRIVDRIKDMIIVSGFNVYPNEVENVIAGHPGVLECAVVGEPHAECGESVVAHVVRKDPTIAADALKAHARSQLTPYKVPRRIVFHDALPKTNVGKVLRRALRDSEPAPPIG